MTDVGVKRITSLLDKEGNGELFEDFLSTIIEASQMPLPAAADAPDAQETEGRRMKTSETLKWLNNFSQMKCFSLSVMFLGAAVKERMAAWLKSACGDSNTQSLQLAGLYNLNLS